MTNSILNSVKIHLGIQGFDATEFDDVLVADINSVFMILNQLGVGPKETFSINGDEEKWSDFFGEETDKYGVKTYIVMKVKKMFDPPQNSTHMNAVNELINEFEWRLNALADKGVPDE